MLLVGLTGGIGSGKSTVAAALADRGAIVLDADELAHAAIAPGTSGERGVLERFPTVARDGHVDRAALASIVFADPEERRALEAIVHPEVRRLFAEACAPLAGTDAVVVFVVPLLVETRGTAGFDLVVAVSAPEADRIERLVRTRGMTPAEARARMAAQASDEARAATADIVIPNDGTPVELQGRVERLWEDLLRRAAR